MVGERHARFAGMLYDTEDRLIRRLVAPFASLGLALVGAPLTAIEVPAGFSVERVATAPSRGAIQLEAIRNEAYGEGVVAGRVVNGVVVLDRYTGSAPSELARLSGFNEEAALVTMRFDETKLFANRLLVSVVHDDGLGGHNVVSDLYAIDSKGRATRLASVGSSDNPVTLNFDISEGNQLFRAGVYLQDRNLRGGSAMYHIDAALNVSVLREHSLPEGRRDVDITSMRFDPTGLYGSFLYLADADDHDNLSGIYVIDEELHWSEATSMGSLERVSYGSLAFSPGGPLDMALYAADVVGGRVVSVSPSGVEREFASGFDRIQSLTIGGHGTEMFVADRDGIHRIFASP